MKSVVEENDELVQFEMSKQNLEDFDNSEFLHENHSRVEKLILSDNNFNQMSPFFLKFDNLIFLDLSRNAITKIENINFLFNLEEFIISHNSIKFIGTSLAHLKKLKHLDLSHNSISINDTVLKSFKYNTELNSLCLAGNVDYNFENNKYKCLEILDKLEVLDNIQIYSKAKSKANKVDIKVTTKKGENKKVKHIKEYIKVMKKDIVENNELYTTIEQKIIPELSKKTFIATSYYFTNKFNF